MAYAFIAKKVAKQNGDIRVAFDMMRSALGYLFKQIEGKDQSVFQDEQSLKLVKVTYQTILDVHE